MYWHSSVLKTMAIESDAAKSEASSSDLEFGDNVFNKEETTMLNLEKDQAETEGTRGNTEPLEVEASDPTKLRKQYAVSVRWERELSDFRKGGMPRPRSSLEGFHMFCCCFARRIGGMFSLFEKTDGSPILIAGPCWPFCLFITFPLIAGIGVLVSYYILFNEKLELPMWVAISYIPLVLFTLIALSCVSCRDPGLLERVTDEEAGHGGWFWNEQVGSFRPTGAMYCRECKALIEDFDHLCPWTGTGIGRRNMGAFKIFVVCVNLSCYFSIGLISYGIVMSIRL